MTLDTRGESQSSVLKSRRQSHLLRWAAAVFYDRQSRKAILVGTKRASVGSSKEIETETVEAVEMSSHRGCLWQGR